MNYDLCDYSTINRILSKYGFTFSKALGQNFLIDSSVCPAMAEMLNADKNTGVLEIGPGIGVLTKELCKTAGKVAAIEFDKRLFPVLEETLSEFDNLKLIEGDVMKLNLNELIEKEFKGFSSIKVCANLPYYITSPVVMRLLESNLPISEIEVMVQKEAAQRLCAQIGSRDAGAVSVAVNYYGNAQILFEVGRESFMPSPKVDSAVIKITLHNRPEFNVSDEKKFFAVVKAAFAQRRKTLVNSLSNSLGLSKNKITYALESLGLDSNIRAEKLEMEDFVNLSDLLYQQ
ncbi:MAG: 16S rRNA (adenine(1518)-N(6)/adenine(1519)-N(6))-dimethyltransferase RsmA [Eubacterium sp.]